MTPVLMLDAGDSVVFQLTGKPTFGDYFHVARTAAQDINAVAGQYIYSALSHIAGQHEFDALFGQCLGDIRFTAASGRGSNLFFRCYFFLVVNGEYSKVFTVSEVFVNLILV
jgi:hypothetical protein